MLKTKLMYTIILFFTVPTLSYAAPVTFHDVLNMALDALEEMELANATRDKSRLKTKQVIADQAPTLSVSVDASNTFTGDIKNIQQRGNASSVTLTGRWNAYQFGRKKLARDNALLDEKNADLTYYKSQATIIKNAVTTYFTLIEIRRQYETQLQSEKSAQTAVNKDSINYQNGTLAESVYLNSQAKYARIKANRIGLKLQLDNMEQEFERIIGFKAPMDLPIPELSKIPLPESLDTTIDMALANNADINTLKNNISKLKNTVTSQKAERKGSISMSASSTKDIKNGGDLRNTVRLTYSVSLDFNKVNRYKVDATTTDLRNNTIRLKIEQNKIRNDVRSFWQTYTTQKYLLDANKITMQANKVAFETEQIMYETGQSTSKELLEKIEAEINSTKQYVTGLKQYALAIVDLLTVTGDMKVEKFVEL